LILANLNSERIRHNTHTLDAYSSRRSVNVQLVVGLLASASRLEEKPRPFLLHYSFSTNYFFGQKRENGGVLRSYFRSPLMKRSRGTAGRLMIFTVPLDPSSTETREIVSLSGASTMFTKS